LTPKGGIRNSYRKKKARPREGGLGRSVKEEDQELGLGEVASGSASLYKQESKNGKTTQADKGGVGGDLKKGVEGESELGHSGTPPRPTPDKRA